MFGFQISGRHENILSVSLISSLKSWKGSRWVVPCRFMTRHNRRTKWLERRSRCAGFEMFQVAVNVSWQADIIVNIRSLRKSLRVIMEQYNSEKTQPILSSDANTSVTHFIYQHADTQAGKNWASSSIIHTAIVQLPIPQNSPLPSLRNHWTKENSSLSQCSFSRGTEEVFMWLAIMNHFLSKGSLNNNSKVI